MREILSNAMHPLLMHEGPTHGPASPLPPAPSPVGSEVLRLSLDSDPSGSLVEYSSRWKMPEQPAAATPATHDQTTIVFKARPRSRSRADPRPDGFWLRPDPATRGGFPTRAPSAQRSSQHRQHRIRWSKWSPT